MNKQSMIERVSRALALEWVRNHKNFSKLTTVEIDAEVYNRWDLYIKEARVAIEAIREPNEEMRIAGVLALTSANALMADKFQQEGQIVAWSALATSSSTQTDLVWQAMIDAVLAEDIR